MKTTVDFDDRLIREAKRRAAADGESLTQLIQRALRGYGRPKPAASRFTLRLLTKKGRTLPGANLDDRDALYERMDEGA